jgi:hypothetical protein
MTHAVLDQGVLDQLREAVEAEHAEMLQALEKLTRYVAKTGKAGAQVNGQTPAKAIKRPAPRKGTGKFRPKVIEVLSNEFLSVQEVVAKTGFTAAQIRGVILSPGLKTKFAKKEVDGVMRYKYEGTP